MIDEPGCKGGKLISLNPARGPELKSLVCELGQKKNICFTGKIQNPYPYFDAADIFVLSSLWEGLPLVLLEAMAMKVPRIILSDCPGSMSEKLDNLNCVNIFSSGDIASLSQSINKSINYNEYPKSDFSDLLDPFLLQNVVRQYESLIHDIQHR